MDSKNAIPISQFGSEQAGILFKTLVFQKLYPGKFLIPNPWPYDELTDEEVEAAKICKRNNILSPGLGIKFFFKQEISVKSEKHLCRKNEC